VFGRLGLRGWGLCCEGRGGGGGGVGEGGGWGGGGGGGWGCNGRDWWFVVGVKGGRFVLVRCEMFYFFMVRSLPFLNMQQGRRFSNGGAFVILGRGLGI